MSRKRARVFSREEKLGIVRRMMAGEKVSALARELKVRRTLLYVWRANFRSGGPEALRTRGRPSKSARSAESGSSSARAATAEPPAAERRIAELERKIGQQQLELDFFRQALRQVRGQRRPSDGPGAQPSTPRSRR
jgi:transposase